MNPLEPFRWHALRSSRRGELVPVASPGAWAELHEHDRRIWGRLLDWLVQRFRWHCWSCFVEGRTFRPWGRRP